MPGNRWRSTDRLAHNVNLTRANQHAVDLKGLYLGLLLRALTGGLDAPGQPEPLIHPDTGKRVNVIRKFKNETAPLIWDGHQRAMETGRVLERVLDANVPGAVVEVGVFRGGLSAYLQGILLARQENEELRHRNEAREMRQYWLIDSFQGLPDASGMQSRNAHAPPKSLGSKWNSAYSQAHWSGGLSVGENTVYATFERFRLLDRGNVHALRGFVNETLPHWPKSKRVAMLRIDVDLYAATYDTLHYLYPKLSPGGAVLFDDFKFAYVREAVTDYRKAHKIKEPIQWLNGTYDPMAYWFKSAGQRAPRPSHARSSGISQ